MFKKTIKYENFNGEKREMEANFSLKQTEIIEFDKKYQGGIQGELTRIAATQNRSGMIALVQDLVLASYGQKSLDGERFIKNEDQTIAFKESNAFDEFVVEICSDETGDKLTKFITGIMPAKLSEEAKKIFEMKKIEGDA